MERSGKPRRQRPRQLKARGRARGRRDKYELAAFHHVTTYEITTIFPRANTRSGYFSRSETVYHEYRSKYVLPVLNPFTQLPLNLFHHPHAMSEALSCSLIGNKVVLDDDLKIPLRRIIRVPDNDAAYFLPPDLGAFPLERVSRFAKKLPKSMADEGDLLFPSTSGKPCGSISKRRSRI
jgi:hypothetical protein